MDTIFSKAFYIMRHGETTDNEKGLISGCRCKPDLTPKGREQAEQARKVYELLETKPERVIVSELKRTHQTAKIVVGHENFIEEPGLNERDLGELDGKITEEKQKELGTLPGEQSPEDHAKQVVEGLNRQLGASDSVPLIVAHGGTTRRILEAVGVKKGIKVNNAQIYHVVPVNDRWKIFELSVVDDKLHRKDITSQTIAESAGNAVPDRLGMGLR